MSQKHTHAGGHGEGSTTGVHGMLLFGEEALYLSHLPMFASPHNFQVLLEVGLDDAGDGPGRTSIEGTIFRGHFERGGEPIAEGVFAEVHRVVHFSELDVGAKRSEDRELTYLCFGRPGQLHLAHEVTARPDFDQVLRVSLVPDTVTNQAGHPLPEDVTTIGFDLAQRVLFSGRSDTPENRLGPHAHQFFHGLFFQTSSLTGAHGFVAQLMTHTELYVEVDELT